MKIFRTGILVVFASFLALVGPVASFAPKTARAAASASAANCTMTPADLSAVAAAAAQGLQAELAARKALLTRVITCAEHDARTSQANLNAMNLTGDAANIQSQLSGKLDDAINYYNLELGKLSQAGIAGTQAVARETLSWRQGNYDPLAAQVSNFILWAGNQAVFTTAANRLNQVKGLASFVDQAAPNPELEGDLATAESLIQTAQNENASAETALAQFVPPDQSLTLIQQSLQSLADAYQKFSDISATVQTLLPSAPSGS